MYVISLPCSISFLCTLASVCKRLKHLSEDKQLWVRIAKARQFQMEEEISKKGVMEQFKSMVLNLVPENEFQSNNEKYDTTENEGRKMQTSFPNTPPIKPKKQHDPKYMQEIQLVEAVTSPDTQTRLRFIICGDYSSSSNNSLWKNVIALYNGSLPWPTTNDYSIAWRNLCAKNIKPNILQLLEIWITENVMSFSDSNDQDTLTPQYFFNFLKHIESSQPKLKLCITHLQVKAEATFKTHHETLKQHDKTLWERTMMKETSRGKLKSEKEAKIKEISKWVLNQKPEHIAEALTEYAAKKLCSALKMRNLIDFVRRERPENYDSKVYWPMDEFIQNFNHTYHMVCSTILLVPNQSIRKKIINHWVEIADGCYKHRNFHSLWLL